MISEHPQAIDPHERSNERAQEARSSAASPSVHNALDPAVQGSWFLVALLLAIVGLLAMVAHITVQ